MASRVILGLYLRTIHLKNHHFLPSNPPSVTNTLKQSRKRLKQQWGTHWLLSHLTPGNDGSSVCSLTNTCQTTDKKGWQVLLEILKANTNWPTKEIYSVPILFGSVVEASSAYIILTTHTRKDISSLGCTGTLHFSLQVPKDLSVSQSASQVPLH